MNYSIVVASVQNLIKNRLKPDPFSCRRQTNDMVVAAVNLLNSHIQDFDAVKVSNFSTLHKTQNLRLKKLRRVQRIFGRVIRA